MSTNHQLDQSQLDLHPDAESLSALAEHQLPEHERQPILAHLATCARCRQILFLAEGAKEAEQPATAGPVLLLSPKKPLVNWRYAWGALAACAALATISIVLYPRHPAAAPEQAKVIAPHPAPVTPAAAPPAEEKKPLPQAEHRQSSPVATAAARPKLKPETSLDSAAMPAAPQQQAAAGSSTTLNITLKPAQSTQTVEVQAANQPLVESEAANISVAADKVQLEAATPPVTETMSAQVVQPKDQIDLKSRNVQPLGAAQPAPKGTIAGSGAAGGLARGVGGGVHAGAVGRPAASAGVPARPPVSFAKMAPRPLTVTPEDEAAAANALQKTLPSGLPAIATASASHHLLAIDSAGALFLSEDAGVVWEPISAQWTGRAASLVAPPAAAGQTAGMNITGKQATDAAAAPAAQATAPTTLFEIVTDQGAHWTSRDGRVWKAK